MLNVPAAWRIKPSGRDLSPWGAGEYGRPLRIVIDDETTPSSTARTLLERFVGHRGVEIYSTRPTAAWRVEIGDQPNANNALKVRYIDPKTEWWGALAASDGLVEYAKHLEADHGLPVEATVRVLRLEAAASRHGLDAVVTGLDIPNVQRRARPGLPLDLTNAESACSVLGLYLRAHNDLIDAEKLSDEELERLTAHYEHIRREYEMRKHRRQATVQDEVAESVAQRLTQPTSEDNDERNVA